MLAVHQEEQEALYQHIEGILPDGRPLVSVWLPSLEIPGLTVFADLRGHPET